MPHMKSNGSKPTFVEAMARPDERLVRSQLHPSVDPQRGDDPAGGKMDARHVRSRVLDLVPPRLRPELTEERELLATDDARVTRRGDLVDPAGPPVVHVDPVHGRPDVEARVVEQQVAAGPLRA